MHFVTSRAGGGSTSYLAHLLPVILLMGLQTAEHCLQHWTISLRQKWGTEIFNYFFYKLPLRSLPRLKTAFVFQTEGMLGERV